MPHSWNADRHAARQGRRSAGTARSSRCRACPQDAQADFWKVRFEGANYRAKVWLNGRLIGGYIGYFPFEVDLDGLRTGRNTLVVKVSSLRGRTDLTHWRPAAFNGYGTGGWWNFGGLLREVYVRQIDTVDIEDVQVLPRAALPARPGEGGGADDAAQPHRQGRATSTLALRGRTASASS